MSSTERRRRRAALVAHRLQPGSALRAVVEPAGDAPVHAVERAEQLADREHPDREADRISSRAHRRLRRVGERRGEPDQPERQPDPHHDRAAAISSTSRRDGAPQERCRRDRDAAGVVTAGHAGVTRTPLDERGVQTTLRIVGGCASACSTSPRSPRARPARRARQHARPRAARRPARLPPLLGRRAPRRADARRPGARGADRADRGRHGADPRRQRRRDAAPLQPAEGGRERSACSPASSPGGSTSASAARPAPTR